MYYINIVTTIVNRASTWTGSSARNIVRWCSS